MTIRESWRLAAIAATVMSPLIVFVVLIRNYTPDETETSVQPMLPVQQEAPACRTCELCLTRHEQFEREMVAYSRGRRAQRGGYDAYVAELCMDKPDCVTAFETLREKYEERTTTAERE